MKVAQFQKLHEDSGLKHKAVALRLGLMRDVDDKAGEMAWHRIRQGEAEMPAEGRGVLVARLAEIYGVNPDKIMYLFDLGT